ncbi:hypothetical protein [Bacillus sp. FJAT-45350]|uniref:hypothetical protein n=1 Tax=Bacillus sp. FJAT-45350 TaxID=2011014 RepID=UPI000BB9992D|nr:hypothetical protein [Bacillus sp. FJAT-45350]
MRCFCEHKGSNNLKVEGDVGADPLWCNKCGCNFDLEEVPVSADLKDQLIRWAMMYGEWIDWSIDRLLPNGVELEDKHNEIGHQLTEEIRKELSIKYKVRFSPSTSARSYSNAGLTF